MLDFWNPLHFCGYYTTLEPVTGITLLNYYENKWPCHKTLHQCVCVYVATVLILIEVTFFLVWHEVFLEIIQSSDKVYMIGII